MNEHLIPKAEFAAMHHGIQWVAVVWLLASALPARSAQTNLIISVTNTSHLPLTFSISYVLTNIDTAPAVFRDPLLLRPVRYENTNHTCTISPLGFARLEVPPCGGILYGNTMTNGRVRFDVWMRSENVTITNSQTWAFKLDPVSGNDPDWMRSAYKYVWKREVIAK